MHGKTILQKCYTFCVAINVSFLLESEVVSAPHRCTNVAYRVSKVRPVVLERMSTREAECFSRCFSVKSTLNTILLEQDEGQHSQDV